MTLDEAVGRVLARDVVSTNTLPVVRASSFDGIAVKSAAFADGLPDTSGWKTRRAITCALTPATTSPTTSTPSS